MNDMMWWEREDKYKFYPGLFICSAGSWSPVAISRLIPPGHPSSGGLYIVHPETLRRGLFGGEDVEMGVQGLFRDALVWQYKDGDSYIKVSIGYYIVLHDTGDRGYLQTVVDNDIQFKATFEKCQSENQGD